VVIGAGIAGCSMVEAIRRVDTQVPLTLITACSGDVYHKPELSTALAKQNTRSDLIKGAKISSLS